MDQDRIWEVFQNDGVLQGVGCKDAGRVQAVARLIPEGASLLNIGVGRGTLEKILVHRNLKVYCLDPSETSITHLRTSLALGERARVGYAQDIPFEDEKFDYVVMTEVLEHLSDTILEQTRGEVARVLRAGGTFLGSVPADEELANSFVVCPECGKIFHRWGHLQSFSEDRLSHYLSVRFKRIHIYRTTFQDWKSLNWKGKIVAAAKKIQAKMGVRGSQQNFVFIAKK